MLLPRLKLKLSNLKTVFRDYLRGETDHTFFDLDNVFRHLELAGLNDFAHSRNTQTQFQSESQAQGQTNFSGNRVFRIYELRSDLRQEFPLAFTPFGRRDWLTWLTVHGVTEYGITVPEIVEALRIVDSQPDRGLAYHYLLNPAWQADFPNVSKSDVFEEFKKLIAKSFDLLNSRWLKNAKQGRGSSHFIGMNSGLSAKPFQSLGMNSGLSAKPFQSLGMNSGLSAKPFQSPGMTPISNCSPEASPGINLIAHFRYQSGLQEAANGLAKALEHQNWQLSKRDLPVKFETDWNDHQRYLGLEVFDTTVFLAAINTFPGEWYPKAGLHQRSNVRKVAVWYWELEEVPSEWHAQMQWPDEVWAPTRFIADAIRKVVRCPVETLLPGVEIPFFETKAKADFGLNESDFTFLATFDIASVMERKNPLGVVAAFKKAFPANTGHSEKVGLVIKVSRGNSSPGDFAKLKDACSQHPKITLIDQVMTRNDVLALMNCVDCYVSLHRSEGLGLGMAESMLLGKPVIATAYSGNMDFMNEDVSYLVRYEKVKIKGQISAQNPYPPGLEWADPSVDHAAELMADVAKESEKRRKISLAGQKHAQNLLSLDSYSQRLTKKLLQPQK